MIMSAFSLKLGTIRCAKVIEINHWTFSWGFCLQFIFQGGEGGVYTLLIPLLKKKGALLKNFENSALSLLSLSIIIKVLNPTW